MSKKMLLYLDDGQEVKFKKLMSVLSLKPQEVVRFLISEKYQKLFPAYVVGKAKEPEPVLVYDPYEDPDMTNELICTTVLGGEVADGKISTGMGGVKVCRNINTGEEIWLDQIINRKSKWKTS
jgi:hypothetical protein